MHHPTQLNLSDSSTPPKKIPYCFFSIPVFLLIILGLVNAGYLAYSHYQNYTDISFNSFCALSKSINCDTVSQSPWSLLFGLPLAYWGLFAYLLFLVVFLNTFSILGASKNLWYLLTLLAVIYSAVSIYFGYISAVKIKAYCILCLVSYAINFILFLLSVIIIRRFCECSFFSGVKMGISFITQSRKIQIAFLILFGVFLSIKFFLTPYWEYTLHSNTSFIPSGITREGHPWIGADTPEITIHEYADYQCFQCSKIHLLLRRIISEHPDKIKLVHHHYPMDHEFNSVVVPEPFHVGSGKMAMISIYAASKNKFWEMNDALYAIGRNKQPFNTETLAKMTGFTPGELAEATRNSHIREFLLHDIRQGMKLHITGTPTYVIDGQKYEGSIPPEVLQTIMR